jgi:glutamine synthetase
MSDSRRNSLGIELLPASLEESLTALKSDLNYLNVSFDKELIDIYYDLKKEEISRVGKDKSKRRQFMFYCDV